ncbi:MAG TPA: hypothetical protein DEH78_12755 [Solibacterales bacterium]|nr:hypothetical protein [Bryobacterales bacterium]
MTIRTDAKFYLGFIYLLAVWCAATAVVEGSSDVWRFLLYLSIALLASGLKVTLPGVMGTMSVNYVFILLGILELSSLETLFIAAAAAIVQSCWHAQRKPNLVQVLFNISSLTIAIAAARACYYAPVMLGLGVPQVLRLGLCAVLYFVTNTSSVAVVIALTERKGPLSVWKECYFWSFPYYLVGACLAETVFLLNFYIGFEFTVAILPVVYLIYRSYRLYLNHLEKEKRHAEEMASLHLRTIEALALAIEAKDDTTHKHLQRVQHYALALGKEMNLSSVELQALQAASILHDIGKLAVPDYIISKPGRLTVEEFEKMKIHPIVGAEILERVGFPYPVVPMVRAHHEKWDGSGYPNGLKGDEIPIGARILSAVDCLDALASDRQYRRCLPLVEAMAFVESEAGRTYDPNVVAILKANYMDWERTLAKMPDAPPAALSKDLVVEHGKAPAAGLETMAPSAETGTFLTSIAAARQEVQTIYEITQDLASSLHIEDTLSVLANRLSGLVPFDCLAIYHLNEGHLEPLFVSGDNARLFSSLRIPLGQGLSGWVALNQKPLVNGNPSVEPGYLNDPSKFSTLRSALAVPLVGNEFRGVLAAYRSERDAFTRDHLRIFLAVSSKVSAAVENSLTLARARKEASTDGLTGLPNASSLFIHLDGELARAKREQGALGVLVCDLDGFKQVNDRFGHLMGNSVLKTVAGILRASCREYDYVARMGGDEFVLVIPGASDGDLQVRIRELDQAVRQAGVTLTGHPIVALSVGDAYFPHHGTDAEALLAEADQRMYRVKRERKGISSGRHAVADLASMAAHMA